MSPNVNSTLHILSLSCYFWVLSSELPGACKIYLFGRPADILSNGRQGAKELLQKKDAFNTAAISISQEEYAD